MISPALMANIEKLLQHPKVLQSLMGLGLGASEAVKGRENEGGRFGLMISKTLLDLFGEDGPLKDPLQGTIFAEGGGDVGVEGVANSTQQNFSGWGMDKEVLSDTFKSNQARLYDFNSSLFG